MSFEFAGVFAGGGIGTYIRNLAVMLADRGHEVEVFCYAPVDEQIVSDAFAIHAVDVTRDAFPHAIAPVFAARNSARPFDVIEGPEFLAETACLSKVAPDVPIVLKLHTPLSFIGRHIDAGFVPLSRKLRFFAGGALRGKLARPYWKPDLAADFERANTMTADEITSPSAAMAHALRQFWRLDDRAIHVIPNVFVPDRALLKIPEDAETNTVLFAGRLELRKGILDFVEAIPLVLAKRPETNFRIVGRSAPHPITHEELLDHVRRRLRAHLNAVEFVGGVPHSDMAAEYARSDICVFPSVWENFPNVCLEAMAAGRGVVASSAGGMAEMIEHGISGLLCPPRNPAALAAGILDLIGNPERRIAMGRAAREHVLTAYNVEIIAPQQEASYRRAIAARAARSARESVRT